MRPAEILRGFVAAAVLAGAQGCVVESDTVAAVYERCREENDCNVDAGSSCQHVFTDNARRGQMCTATCTSDSDCPPPGGVCLAGVDPVEPDGGKMLPSERGCFKRCGDDYDCGFGFACTSDPIGAVTPPGPICVPD